MRTDKNVYSTCLIMLVSVLLIPLVLVSEDKGKTMNYKKVITEPEDYVMEEGDYDPSSIFGTWLINEDKGISNFLGEKVQSDYLLYIDGQEKSGEIALYNLYRDKKRPNGTIEMVLLDELQFVKKVPVKISHIGDGTYEMKYKNKKRIFKIEYNGVMTIYFDDSTAYGGKSQKNGHTDGRIKSKKITDEPIKKYHTQLIHESEMESPGDC